MNNRCYILTVLFCLFNSLCLGDHGREIRPSCWRNDATVNDVFFVDAQHGWIVGNQGLIERTIDGGRTWHTCTDAGLDLDGDRTLKDKLKKMRPLTQTHELYPLTCDMTSVFFADQNRGWIVGNYYTPYLGTCRSVLLATGDGGKSWHQFKGNILPRINRIYFQSVLGGWALGHSGNLFKTGVFTTSSGGRLWSEKDLKSVRNWADGELVESGFVVIDENGIPGRIYGNQFEPAVVFGNPPGKLRAIRMFSHDIGWAVGNSGTILQTKDGGKTWRRSEAFENKKVPAVDFSTVAIGGRRAYLAGNPGTIVVSFDAASGEDVKFHSTNFKRPIQKLYFDSQQMGWAAGSGGLVASTNDAGENWKIIRGDHDRVAVLFVVEELKNLPLAAISMFANEENRLSACAVLGQFESKQLGLAETALARIGCSSLLELRGEDLSSETPRWDPEKSTDELARAILTHCPNVVVCSGGTSLELKCRTAIEQAKQPQKILRWSADWGLDSWSVDRLMVQVETGGDIRFEPSRYLPRTGVVLEDQIAISRALINRSPIMEESENYRVDSFTGTVSVKDANVVYGLKELGHSVPTRNEPLRMGNLNSIATAPLKRKEFDRLFLLPRSTAEEMNKIQNEIRAFGVGQEARESGIWLMQLAERWLQAGEFELAAFSLEQLIARTNNHPFSPAALKWLTHYYSSDEIRAAIASQFQSNESSLTPIGEDSNSKEQKELEEFLLDESKAVRQVTFESEIESEDRDSDEEQRIEAQLAEITRYRDEQAHRFLNRLKQYDLDFAQSAEVQFTEAMLPDQKSHRILNQNLLNRIRRKSMLDQSFAKAASRELKSRQDNSGLEMTHCSQIGLRPKLDGLMDDDCWQKTIADGKAVFKKAANRRDGAAKTDLCVFNYDEEFLYLFVRNNWMETQPVVMDHLPRQRDSDLSKMERIKLSLDFDRDLQSTCDFEMDYRGWGGERCSGATEWDPEWFFAVHRSEKCWTAEIAIPLRELTIRSIEDLDCIAYSIARIDSDGNNLWLENDDRRQEAVAATGLMAGLFVRPEKFDFLVFEPGKMEDSPKTYSSISAD